MHVLMARLAGEEKLPPCGRVSGYLRFTLSYRDVEDLLAERGSKSLFGVVTKDGLPRRPWRPISGKGSSPRCSAGRMS
jgi:hypothetical protein